ncbi:P-loop containing nucleoside triphosphate hydrolase protein [Marasmius fiardii PR-910]|nr:P-loop containing nucleoside triphosphate hydrolase protein [Marasmius fiardii PR-910]
MLNQTPRVTRSSVLGKRSHQRDGSLSSCEQLQTPDTPTHKRIRISSTVVDGDANKENVPPFSVSPVELESSPVSPRMTRSLRRNATESMVTPTRPRISSGRRASFSSELSPTTPATAISQLSLITPPSTPPVLLPIHVRVRALLRPTCNNIHDLPGRETERTTITEFITNFLDGRSASQNSTLFVSGTPGTGKTAIINSIIHSIEAEYRHVRIVLLNCMALSGLDALWDRLLEEFHALQKGRSKKQLKGREGVEAILKTLKTKCILVLDELDHIASTLQSLSQLFSLTASCDSVLRVIGIANTHTLTSSTITTPDVQTIHFSPYTSAQLQKVLQSRLSILQAPTEGSEVAGELAKFLPNPTTTLLAKKVAAMTGDVRALLEVLRGAIDLTVKSKANDVLASPSYSVTPAHVLSSLKAYTPSPSSPAASSAPSASSLSPTNSNSEIVAKTKGLSLQARLALLSLLLASKRVEAGLSIQSSSVPSPTKRSTSLGNTKEFAFDIVQLHSYYSLILSRGESGICSAVSRPEFADLIGMLEGVGLLSVGPASGTSPAKSVKRGLARTPSFAGGASKAAKSGIVKLSAGVWTDEVLKGLGVGIAAQDIKEEEINALWVQESSRLTKDLRAAESKARREECGVGFSEAVED